MAVAWFHFTDGTPGFLQEGLLKTSGAKGWLGVEVFFVISGFIIPYALRKGGYHLRRHWKVFVAKRLIRLDPPYLACVVLVVALQYASSITPGFHGKPPDYTWTQLALHLGYLNAFYGGDWVNPVFWTLAIEFQFYLVIALLYPLLSDRRAWVRFACLAAFATLALSIPSPTLVFHWLCLFGLGIISFQFFIGLTDLTTYFVALMAMTAVCYVTLGAMITGVGFAAALAITFIRIRPTRVLTLLGAISYSVYLLHAPIGGRVINLGVRLPPTLLNRGLTLALAVLVTVVAAYVFYRVIELPAQKWSAGIKYGR
jgi:peptidoglycan/LPS O-acetylase OafA/YrhL